MIKSITMYSVVCDRCKKVLKDDCMPCCTSWTSKQSALCYAFELGWEKIGNKHYCPNCCKFNNVLNPEK